MSWAVLSSLQFLDWVVWSFNRQTHSVAHFDIITSFSFIRTASQIWRHQTNLLSHCTFAMLINDVNYCSHYNIRALLFVSFFFWSFTFYCFLLSLSVSVITHWFLHLSRWLGSDIDFKLQQFKVEPDMWMSILKTAGMQILYQML